MVALFISCEIFPETDFEICHAGNKPATWKGPTDVNIASACKLIKNLMMMVMERLSLKNAEKHSSVSVALKMGVNYSL